MIPYSQLRQQPRQDLREVIPLEKPFTILIDPSSICNFCCVQCFQSVENVAALMPRGIMQFQDFKKIMDDLKGWGGPRIKVLRFIGFGEPLVNKKYCAMLQYAKELDLAERIETTSNGSLLTPAISEKMIEYGLDYLRVSIYSALQKKHEAVTKNNIEIQRIFDNLRYLRELKENTRSKSPFVYVKMLDAFNDAENRLFFEKYGPVADEIMIEQPHNWLDMSNKDFIGDLYQGLKGEVLGKLDYQATLKKVCPQPFKMMSIRYNGDVVVCDPDWLNNTKIGNALEQPLNEIWDGEAMYQFRRMQLENRRCENPSCKACNTFLTDNYTVDNLDGFPVEKLRRLR